MSTNNAMSQRKADLEFLKLLIKRGRTRSMSEGNRFMIIIDLYPVEIWYLCQELNPGFYQDIGGMVELSLKGFDPSLN